MHLLSPMRTVRNLLTNSFVSLKEFRKNVKRGTEKISSEIEPTVTDIEINSRRISQKKFSCHFL